MTRLVTPEGTRAVVDHNELLSLSPDQREVELILDQLVRARLIHLHTDPSQGATVEIVHEMLITEWPTLQRWLEDSHAMRGFMAELRQAARQWAARGKPQDLVWRGVTAQEALGHVKRQLLDLSAIEKEYLDAVRRQTQRGRRVRVLVFTSVFTALGLVLAGGSFALVKIKIAEAEAQEKAKQAEIDRAEAVAAKGELQGKLDIIEEEKRKREAADKDKLTAEEQKRKAEEERQRTLEEKKTLEEQSKEQLAESYKKLQQTAAEAQAAEKKALAQEALAKKALDEANKAKATVERLLEQKRQELDTLKKRASEAGIIDKKL
jgi:DNA repair exonuclease SbcCD ATPase subunit